jgi:uncharacterized membrane protein
MSSATATAAAPRARSQTKLVFFLLFFAVTAFVTYGKNAEIFNAASPIAQHFAPGRLYLIPHAFFASLALVLAAFQFSNRLRARYLQVHRVLGYVYVTSVAIAAPMGVLLARTVAQTPSITMASAVQSFGWMVTTGIALYCIRHGNVQQHRRWMIRSYPFAMVFTIARLIIPLPPIMRLGAQGVEAVVWTSVALAAFLPSLFLEWRSIVTART